MVLLRGALSEETVAGRSAFQDALALRWTASSLFRFGSTLHPRSNRGHSAPIWKCSSKPPVPSPCAERGIGQTHQRCASFSRRHPLMRSASPRVSDEEVRCGS